MANYMKDLLLEGVRIFHKNFSGRATQFNREGDRNFSVILPPEIVDAVINDGWRVRTLPPKADVEGSEPLNFIDVRVNYDSTRPPEVYLVTAKNTILLDKDTVGTIDRAEIVNVDLILHPHPWEAAGKSGVKAYLKKMYITIADDPLAEKYGTGFYASPVLDDEENPYLPQ